MALLYVDWMKSWFSGQVAQVEWKENERSRYNLSSKLRDKKNTRYYSDFKDLKQEKNLRVKIKIIMVPAFQKKRR